ncbi:response regulator [Sulfuricurvum sp.]|uniref:response regulator transcription factor n=1 Tax=Sulfuricurvum sp. TaxID=2025608 RepID=UPI0025DBD07A|nr:response regulator [Sulfuricurvum sp.]
MNTEAFMTHTNVKQLKEIGFTLSVLYVEDDLEIQQQLKSFFLRFFGRVDTANNGIEALDLYKNNSYDLIITDLTMPQMGGMQLTSAIRILNASQPVIVVSAYSESEKLIELINIGVDGFILKPVEINRVVETLLKSAQAIYDREMVHYFNTLLERTNSELRASNIELESTLNQLGRLREECKGELITDIFVPIIPMCGPSLEEFYTLNDTLELNRTNEDLEQIEDDFNLLLVSSDRKTTENLILSFNQLLRAYAHEIHLIPQCHELGYALMQMSRRIDGIKTENIDTIEYLIPLITALFDYLEQWRRGIFVYHNVDNVHFMDDYLIKKITEIEMSIEN